MSSKMKSNKRPIDDSAESSKELDLFSNHTTTSNDEADSDSTDSEESVYSGLEDEADTSEESGDEDDLDIEKVGDSSNSDDDTDEEENEDDAEDSEELEDEDEEDEEDEESAKVKEEDDTKGVLSKTKGRKGSTGTLSITQDSLETSEKKSNSSESSTSAEANVTVPDEYEYDSSDEEDLRNTVGNIPMEWYREYEHIGYNLHGKKIMKPQKGDELDNFLNKMENPDYWRTVVDKTTGQSVVLSDKDAEIIRRFRRGKYVDSSYDPYKPWVDFFSYDTMIHPVTNRPADKRSFIPSKWERLKVGRMVHAIKMGWMKPRQEKKEDEDEPNYYLLWGPEDQTDITKRFSSRIPAPKLALPGHEESYNPPPEYLPTEEEELVWNNEDPEDRRQNFLPKSYPSLRQVPAYSRFINERFERCLDLYLCPRQRKMRMNVDPEDLLPKLPKPKDLQPFPTVQALIYKGHSDLVRCISVDPTGQWLVSGSDDKTVKFWEVATARCMKTLQVDGIVKSVSWNPNAALCLVAVTVEENIHIINPQLGDKIVISNTDSLIQASSTAEKAPESGPDQADWQDHSGTDYEKGFRLKITHSKSLGQVTWHARGDYLAVVIPGGESKSVLIHQVSRRRSQNPFRKSKGLVQCVLFHPTRPFLFVATQRYVRVYNLLKQELTKKLMTNVKWVSSMAVHPGGDNVIIGSYDCRLSWFDLDLSTKPYQTLRHHKKAIRQVCYHKKYPLFASASDDGSLIICHGRVFNDLLQNPLIVPVKVLRGHDVKNKLGVLDCAFHPTQPWIFSSGGDGTIRLFS